MEFDLLWQFNAKKKKKKNFLLGILYYTWGHQRSFEFERFIIPLKVR